MDAGYWTSPAHLRQRVPHRLQGQRQSFRLPVMAARLPVRWAMSRCRTAPVNAVILDSYGRAYDIDLAHGLNATTPRLRLTPALVNQGRSVSVRRRARPNSHSRLARTASAARTCLPLALSDGQQRQARISGGPGERGDCEGHAFQSRHQASRCRAGGGIAGHAWQCVSDRERGRLESGFERRPGNSFALRQQVGAFGLTGSVESWRSAAV